MINIVGNTAKQRFRVQVERRMISFQRVFWKSVLSILKKQYKDAAKNIESYEFNFNYAIEKYNKELRNIYQSHYKRVIKEFGESALRFAFDETVKSRGNIPYQTKSFIDDFWRHGMAWMAQNTANKVMQVTQVTKRDINRIVRREMRQDHTNKEIAKKINEIAEISLPFRALRIARTETHSAANWATDKAMDVSRLMKEKEWISALDERTRTVGKGNDFDHVAANGERVAMDDTFKRTGENLRFPGDYENGSAGNIINCRCVPLYHTNVQTRRSGE